MSNDNELIEMSIQKIEEQKSTITEKQLEIDELKRQLSDVQALINESYGVIGLHLNGDTAPWSELVSGGRFEEWLCDTGLYKTLPEQDTKP